MCFQTTRRVHCLPTFLVVGFTKAGTSVFFQYLSQHTLIRTSPIKEPAYLGSDVEVDDALRDAEQAPLHPSATLASSVASAGRSSAARVRPYVSAQHKKTLRWYLGLFKPCTRCERGEATPGYAWRDYSPIAMQQAHRLLGPSLRLVMLVREPLHRAASHYLYFQSNRRRFRRDANLSEALSHGLAEFERCAEQLRGWRHQCTYRDGRRAVERTSALLEGRHPEMWRLRHGKASFELIQAGLYSEHIATWEATFEPRQLLVMDAEDLIVRPLRVLRRVERHLKLPCAKYSLSTEHALASVTGNTTRSPGRAASEALAGISLALQQQLQRFFEPFNARLRERTGIQWGDQSTPQAPNSSTIQ